MTPLISIYTMNAGGDDWKAGCKCVCLIRRLAFSNTGFQETKVEAERLLLT